MTEKALLALAVKELLSPKGKKLLGTRINVKEITNKISSLIFFLNSLSLVTAIPFVFLARDKTALSASFSKESTIAFLALATRPRSLAINLAPEVVREEERRVVQDNLNNWSSVAGMNFIIEMIKELQVRY